MRHVYIRSILALVWLAAAIYSAVSGNIVWVLFYVIIGGTCSFSAYRMWKKERDDRGGN